LQQNIKKVDNSTMSTMLVFASGVGAGGAVAFPIKFF